MSTGQSPGGGKHAASSSDPSRGLLHTLSVGRPEWLRIPFLELSAVWLLRRRLAIYLYELEPFFDFWRGRPMTPPARYHHLLLTGPWVLAFAISLLGQMTATALGHAFDHPGLDDGYAWAYVYTVIPLSISYHLACALLAGRSRPDKA